ncbi:hypothetical protein BS78_10G063000 [Paspalum vaginatum]|nr:hypothetical protein BS78_10G063000 [Paspalum vaginatum]
MYIYHLSESNGSTSSNKDHSSSDFTIPTELHYRTVPILTQDKMKNSLPLVAVVIVLFLVAARVQGIRLDAESHEAFSNQMVNKPGVMAVKNADNESSNEKMGESISEEKDRVGHSLPEIHVDYYGPRGHKPRHH